MDDRAVAARAARAAGAVALRRHGGPLEVEVKSGEPTDVVTVADREAEAAAVATIAVARPEDAVSGEEGTDRHGVSGRRWVIDAIDGTLNYSLGLPSWCAAVVLLDGDGPLASAVYDPERDELFSAARAGGATLQRGGATLQRGGATPARPATASSVDFVGLTPTRSTLAVREAVPLDRAAVSCHWGFGKLAHPGVRELTRRIVDGVGALRIPGSGTLELAWVAAGRLHGWLQPNAMEWDWLPGALLVREAGGIAIEVDDGPTPWMLGGHADTVAALGGLLRQGSVPPVGGRWDHGDARRREPG